MNGVEDKVDNLLGKLETNENKEQKKQETKAQKTDEAGIKKENLEVGEKRENTLRKLVGVLITLLISLPFFVVFYLSLTGIKYLLVWLFDWLNWRILPGADSWIPIISALSALFVALLIIYYKFAPKNKSYTFVYEATAKARMSGGEFKEMLYRKYGYILDANGYLIKTEKKRFSFLGGMVFFGIGPFSQINWYYFAWTGLDKDGKADHHPKESLDYISLRKDTYYAILEEAEDAKGITLKVGFLLTLQVVNPQKAMFAPENWLEMVITRSLTVCRQVISSKDYFGWLKDHQKEAGKDILAKIKEDGLWQTFWDDIGIEMLDLGIWEIKPPAKIAEAAEKPAIAEREKEAEIINAERDKIAMTTRAEGKKAEIDKVYGAYTESKDRMLIRMIEAIEASPGKGSKWIISFPEVSDLVKKISGMSNPEAALKSLPELIAKAPPEDIEKLFESITKRILNK